LVDSIEGEVYQMNGLQTKSNIENLDQLFKCLDCISCIELTPKEAKRETTFAFCVKFKPRKMKTLVNLHTSNDESFSILFTELSTVEYSNGITTIRGTHFETY
jgi:succinate dehydrogenase/fumarate reductase-like Fe-S protein